MGRGGEKGEKRRREIEAETETDREEETGRQNTTIKRLKKQTNKKVSEKKNAGLG